MEDTSTREHIHTQRYPYRFQTETYAPLRQTGGTGRGRFSVEAMIYVPGMGWDSVNPFVKGNDFIISFYYYIKMHELMGYEHVGLSAAEIKKMYSNLWGEFPDNEG